MRKEQKEQHMTQSVLHHVWNMVEAVLLTSTSAHGLDPLVFIDVTADCSTMNSVVYKSIDQPNSAKNYSAKSQIKQLR